MCDARRPQEEDGNLRAALKAVITSLPREESPLPGRQAKEAAGGLRGEKQGPPNHGTLFPEHCFPGFPRDSDSDRWMPQEGEKGLLPSLLGALIPAHALPLASAVQEETRRPWRGSRVWGTERPVTGMVSGLHALVQLELISLMLGARETMTRARQCSTQPVPSVGMNPSHTMPQNFRVPLTAGSLSLEALRWKLASTQQLADSLSFPRAQGGLLIRL